VLWLGQVNVRKGIHYLLEAARLLEKEVVEFWVAGPLGIRKEVTALASKNVKWLGPVPRSETPALYQQCDVFLLPTLSDGFALTQLEALAHGLPVIVTPNCGRVVEDGVTGFVIPARNAQALADTILRFMRNPNLVQEMSPKCRETAAMFSIDAYGQRLVEIINQRMEAQARIC
jgi:glycosyltransferase involved in cell wall biosynthesis